jgi:hypothetical protein
MTPEACKYNLYLPLSKGEGYDSLQKSAEYILYLNLSPSHNNVNFNVSCKTSFAKLKLHFLFKTECMSGCKNV